uniref:Uncharacterized protein n=1 Tax=Arundo donax TaxID=35708 RepID=A0A0A8YZX7_ARUDO
MKCLLGWSYSYHCQFLLVCPLLVLDVEYNFNFGVLL